MKPLIFLLLLIASLSCRPPADDLDLVKGFYPQDKYFKAGLASLHFILETSPVSRVDSVFGDVVKQYQLPVRASGCASGTFTGSSPFDAFDYRHVARIAIDDERIVSVAYDEVDRAGVGKRGDSTYCREMSVTGTTPALAYPAMEKQLLAEQDLMKVDAVTGASYSLYRFRYAVCVALMKARLERESQDKH